MEEHMAVVSGPHARPGVEIHLEGHYEWRCFCGEHGGEYESRPAAKAAALAHGEAAEARAEV